MILAKLNKQDLHARLIVESLNSGKWVFCEKPMAETEEETRAVLAAEESSKGKLAIGFNRRFAPAYARAIQLMQKVPRPWYINYRLMYPSPQKQGEKTFYSTQPRLSGVGRP
ncbi:MAG: Gfo/Idh/MocA family oxidoreductase [Armatimonadetes bacterium]|nr:Gfo/Idh/MocA family oxidoreductase [Armatimonadota bacterium]